MQLCMNIAEIRKMKRQEVGPLNLLLLAVAVLILAIFATGM